jgi:hypothetical protein
MGDYGSPEGRAQQPAAEPDVHRSSPFPGLLRLVHATMMPAAHLTGQVAQLTGAVALSSSAFSATGLLPQTY